MVSVLIPCYNCKKFIKETLDSVIIQGFDDIEVIIVDDYSSDGSFELVSELYGGDSRFVLHKNPQNMGVAFCRNKSFDLSRGEYIALLDSDDVWEEGKLKKQLNLLLKSDCDICCTGALVISNEGLSFDKFRYVDEVVTFDNILRNNIIVNSTVVMKRLVMEKVKFRSKFFHEDYVFWLEAMKNDFNVVGINQPLIKYRLGGRSKNKFNAAKHRWDIYRRFLGFGIWKSFYYMIHYAKNALAK